MDLNKIPLFAALTRRLDWLGARQRVLAENVANADTPGYRPSDLKPQSFRDLVQGAGKVGNGVHLAATRPGHIGARAGGAGAISEARERAAYESSPTGNAVVLEQQLMKVAETQLEHQTIANLYRKHVNMVRLAIGRRGG